MLFAGTIQVAVAFRRFQCILCRLVLRMPISMACLNLYTLGIVIEGCFDSSARSDATHIRRKRWVHGLDPKVAKPIVHEVGSLRTLVFPEPIQAGAPASRHRHLLAAGHGLTSDS
jgi:hypothetical protein